MPGIVFDTSVYISAFRRQDPSIFLARTRPSGENRPAKPLWLSAVVLEELYAGAEDRRMKRLLGSVEKSFEKIGRLLVPIASDWSVCGRLLSLIGSKYGYEGNRQISID